MVDPDVCQQVAEKYEVPIEAIETLAELLEKTGGLSVRFDIEVLGGQGIWKQGVGGSIGNGFDDAANKRITEICKDISDAIRTAKELPALETEKGGLEETIGLMPISLIPNAWWPDDFGLMPDVLGNAGTIRYAYFEDHDRLIIRQNLRNRIYDTTGHKVIKLIPGEKAGYEHYHIKTENTSVAISELTEIKKT